MGDDDRSVEGGFGEENESPVSTQTPEREKVETVNCREKVPTLQCVKITLDK